LRISARLALISQPCSVAVAPAAGGPVVGRIRAVLRISARLALISQLGSLAVAPAAGGPVVGRIHESFVPWACASTS
jgi:hypothetical protein